VIPVCRPVCRFDCKAAPGIARGSLGFVPVGLVLRAG